MFGFTYDAMNRLLGQTAAGTNGGTETISYTYDAMDNVRTMADSSGTTTYTYDGFGRLTKEEKDGITKVYGYDTNGNRTQFTLTVNGVEQMDTSYTYDKLDRLETVTNGTVTSSYTYNKNGQLLTDTTGSFATTYSYNAGGLITNLTTNNGTSQLQSHSYQYLPDGNISQKQSAVWTQGTQYNYQYSYHYDDAGRLTQENCNGDKKRYFYDAFGNRSEMMVSGPESWTENYTYDANNRLLKVVRLGTDLDEEVNYTYDANGNQLSWNKSVYTQTGTPEISLETDGNDFGIYGYDLYNRVTSYTDGVTSASYTYDGNNLRQSKTVNGVTTGHIWDGQNMVLETHGSSTKKYYRGANGIAYADLIGTVNYYLKDAHGDVTALADAAGTITKNYLYDAFGNEQTGAADTNPFRYAGEYRDSETGNIYLRNRYYDPSTGRFITEDPIRDGLNWYVYAGNNPIRYIDSLGLYYIEKIDNGRGHGSLYRLKREEWWQIPFSKTMAAFSGYLQSNIETKFFNIVGGNSSAEANGFEEESQRQLERQIPGAGVIFNILTVFEGVEKTYTGLEIRFLDDIAFGLLQHAGYMRLSASKEWLDKLMNATYRFIENTPYFNASMGTAIFSGETLHRLDYNISQAQDPQKKIDEYYTKARMYYIRQGHRPIVAEGEARYITGFLEKYKERREEMFSIFEQYLKNNL